MFLGAGHGDELLYLFKNQYVPEVKAESTIETIIKRMTKLWTNFSKYANPNPKEKDELLNVEWKPVNKAEWSYLNIDEELSVGMHPDIDRIAFWDKLYEELPDTKYW